MNQVITDISNGQMAGLTARVLIPVKSVTVAEPPRINIELTMMFVASLHRRVQ